LDLLAPFAPTYEELHELRQDWNRYYGQEQEVPILANRYKLVQQVPCGEGEECFVSVPHGLAGFVKPCFVRRFPVERLQPALIDAVRARGALTERGLEQIYDLGKERDRGFLVTEYVEGAGIDRLDRALHEQGRALSWPVALALLLDAGQRLDALHAAGLLHDDLTPARVRLSLRGMVYLCHGLPEGEDGAKIDVAADHCTLARCVLPLACPAERQVVQGLLVTTDSRALAVLCDQLLERHPQHADLLLPCLLCRCPDPNVLGGRRYTNQQAREAVSAHLDPAEAEALWRLVLECSPDVGEAGYERLKA
jgi:hypothetical protein